MGRCQSTPGLVESKDKKTIEEMWISPHPLPSATLSFATQQTWVYAVDLCRHQTNKSLTFSTLPYSPKSHRRESNTDRTRITDSPGSMSPSVHSSDERPRSRITSHASRPPSQPNRNGNCARLKSTEKTS